jgi:hypothetical protein
MSFVTVVPEFVGQAVGQLQDIGSALSEAHATAAASTTSVVAAAGDEVSAAIASLFSSHAQAYQALNAQAEAFHAEFMNLLNAGTSSYVSAEIANTSAAATFGDTVQSIVNNVVAAVNGASVQEFELPLDAAGAVITAAGALGQSGTAAANAVLAGNPTAAMAALANIAPSVQSAFLYGQYPLTVSIPSISGLPSVAINVPFGGVLAPLQPITVTTTTTGNPPTTIAFPEQVGGIVTNVQANGPSVALALLLLPLFLL